MKTLGIDFAAQPRKTAACCVVWQDGHAQVEGPVQPATDARLIELAVRSDRIGIDVPFGWPVAFVTAISGHSTRSTWPETEWRDLCYRKTDCFVHQKTGRWPLSVSTDHIGITAFRMARLVPTLTGTQRVDRTGRGKLVEVYPAAALRQWGMDPKSDTPALFGEILSQTSGWLRISVTLYHTFQTNRHALDALIAALITRAAAIGLCEPIPGPLLAHAKREGWIALPVARSLTRLMDAKKERDARRA